MTGRQIPLWDECYCTNAAQVLKERWETLPLRKASTGFPEKSHFHRAQRASGVPAVVRAEWLLRGQGGPAGGTGKEKASERKVWGCLGSCKELRIAGTCHKEWTALPRP